VLDYRPDQGSAFVDLAPTLLPLLGLPVPGEMTGTNLLVPAEALRDAADGPG